MKGTGTFSRFSLNQVLKGNRYILLTALISIPFFFSRLYEPSLSGDAAKYALIAKNMLKTGDFLVPSLGYELYFKKPPAFFWIIALSFKVFGVNEFAARFPSALFALLDSILLFLLSRRITKDERLSFIAAAVFTANFEVIRISTVVRMESFIVFLNLLTLIVMAKPSLKRGIAIGIPLGLGIMAKGPFPLISLISLTIYFSVKRSWKPLLYSLICLLISLIPFTLYTLYMAGHHREFLNEFFINQIAERFTGRLKEGTVRSAFFYERIILKHFWPWNLFLLLGAPRIFRERIKLNGELLYPFLTAFLLTFIPLHFVGLKFTRYSYYLYPFLSFVSAFGLRVKPEKVFIPIATAYALVSLMCPCSFHRDKMKELRPLIEVALSNYKDIGISRRIDKDTKNAILFYFDVDWNERSFNVDRAGGNCVIKGGRFCISRLQEAHPLNHLLR